MPARRQRLTCAVNVSSRTNMAIVLKGFANTIADNAARMQIAVRGPARKGGRFIVHTLAP